MLCELARFAQSHRLFSVEPGLALICFFLCLPCCDQVPLSGSTDSHEACWFLIACTEGVLSVGPRSCLGAHSGGCCLCCRWEQYWSTFFWALSSPLSFFSSCKSDLSVFYLWWVPQGEPNTIGQHCWLTAARHKLLHQITVCLCACTLPPAYPREACFLSVLPSYCCQAWG